MESVKAIAYGLYAPTRGTYLGKLGSWYSDVRLASVYAEPRAARMAMSRLDVFFPVAIVEIQLSVSSQQLENAAAGVAIPSQPETATPATGEAKPAPKPPIKAPTKAA